MKVWGAEKEKAQNFGGKTEWDTKGKELGKLKYNRF
jgi:hypothetical protein